MHTKEDEKRAEAGSHKAPKQKERRVIKNVKFAIPAAGKQEV